MAIEGAKGAAAALVSQSPIERLAGQRGATLDAEKQRLRKASKEFEAFFMYQLLKTMRKTIPKSPLGDQAMVGGMGKDIFTDMFDMELSRSMVGNQGAGSISEMLYRSLEERIEADFADSSQPTAIKPLSPAENTAIEFKRQSPVSIPESPTAVPLDSPAKPRFESLQRPQARVSEDPVLSRFGEQIQAAARDSGLDAGLIVAVIRAESSGDTAAVSPAGAKGLMQLADSTASDYGVSDPFDPDQNIKAGASYLADLLDRFGSLPLALAAYNAGPATVERYGGIPPYRETREYIDRVTRALGLTTNTAAKGR